ncbi:hypothetical protein [Polaribacter sp. 20A6]|nr:hypothetical protein [Polaribacter sp. 20A6]
MKLKQTLLLFFTGLSSLGTFAQVSERSNVIFLMPDDISHSAFSYYKEH